MTTKDNNNLNVLIIGKNYYSNKHAQLNDAQLKLSTY